MNWLPTATKDSKVKGVLVVIECPSCQGHGLASKDPLEYVDCPGGIDGH